MKHLAIIFDINGTLIDTEEAHFLGYRDILSHLGVTITIEDFTETWSRRGGKLGDFLRRIGRSDLLPQAETLKMQKDDIFQRTLADRVTLMPGARDCLTRLKQEDIPLGIDTSGCAENTQALLQLFQLNAYFSHIANADTPIDESRYGSRKTKQARLASLCDRFGLPPGRCVMVGDAEKDWLGARAAGLRSIAIPNIHTQSHDFSGADRVLRSLEELTPEMVEAIVG